MKKIFLTILILLTFQNIKTFSYFKKQSGTCTKNEDCKPTLFSPNGGCCINGECKERCLPLLNCTCYKTCRTNMDCAPFYCCDKNNVCSILADDSAKCDNLLKNKDGSLKQCNKHDDCGPTGCCDLRANVLHVCVEKCDDAGCVCREAPKKCTKDEDCPNGCCNLKAITTDMQTCQTKCKDGSCACWKFKNLGEVCYTNFDCDTNQHHYCGDLKLDKTKGTLSGVCKKD